jgi:hypothetical protein
MEGEIIIFEKLAPVAESPGESSPPVVASPALQQPPIIELLVTQQLPCVHRKIINAARCGSFVYIQQNGPPRVVCSIRRL